MMKQLAILIVLALLLQPALAQSSNVQKETKISTITAPPRYAGELVVTKTAPSEVAFGQEFTVQITVFNNATKDADILVEEPLPSVEVTSQKAEIRPGPQPPRITWTSHIPAGGSQTFNYTAKPHIVGMLTLPPTTVYVEQDAFVSDSASVHVGCTAAPTCDERIGETPLRCPAKCIAPAGSEDLGPPPEVNQIPYVPKPAKANKTNVTAPVPPVPAAEKPAEPKGGSVDLLAGIATVAILLASSWFLFLRKK